MVRSNRQSTLSVSEVLFKEPYRFEFHQAIKLLESLFPQAIPFGETINPWEEVVSIKSRIYLESLASDIYSLENIPLDLNTFPFEPSVLHINFMGIAGIQGPLPFSYTEMIIQRIKKGDKSLKDFLDIFNHRLASILHRIRKQYLMSLNTSSPEKTEIAVGLKAFIGIGQPSLQHRLYAPDRSLLNYAGLYWTHPRSAEGLKTILNSYFHIPVRIQKCTGRWRLLSPHQCTRIGRKGTWQKLGLGATLGTRVWDQMGHFHLLLGPLTRQQLDTFLPRGRAFHRLNDLTKLYVSLGMDFSLIYSVKNPPSTQLSQKSYLGWRTWLGASLKAGDDVRLEERV